MDILSLEVHYLASDIQIPFNFTNLQTLPFLIEQAYLAGMLTYTGKRCHNDDTGQIIIIINFWTFIVEHFFKLF